MALPSSESALIETTCGTARTNGLPTAPRLLERLVELQLRCAAILRANGRASEASRCEQFASRLRLSLDEPKAVQRMHVLAGAVCESSRTEVLLERALEGAISLIGADLGNIQLPAPSEGALRIATEAGFCSEFLEHFAVVDDDSSACGRAASRHAQTVIVDVNQDAAFALHREIAAASRFRAVQSTPLLDHTGCLRGVISTHFRDPHHPSSRDLQLMQWYAEQVGDALAHQHKRPTTLHEACAALHARTAKLHDAAAALLDENARTLRANGNETTALARQEWALRALDRARQERERTQALAERVRAYEKRHPSRRSSAGPFTLEPQPSARASRARSF